MSKAIAKRPILTKENAFKVLKCVFAFLEDIYNPKKILRRIKEDIKRNWVYYLLGIGILGLLVFRFLAKMDFSLGGILDGQAYSMLAGGNMFEGEDMLGIDEDFTSQTRSIYDGLKSIGMSLAVLYWMIELGTLVKEDHFSVETFFISMIKLVVAVFLIDNGWRIIETLIDFGNALNDLIRARIGVAYSIADSTIDSGSTVLKIVDIIRLLVPLIIFVACGLVARLVLWMRCITRNLKLCVYMALAPIALADITGGSHSTSINYLKRILALCLEGAILLAMNFFIGTLMSSLALDAGESIWQTLVDTGGDFLMHTNNLKALVYGLTGIGLYSKSEEISMSLVGLH